VTEIKPGQIEAYIRTKMQDLKASGQAIFRR
jgi:hypothetical protein